MSALNQAQAEADAVKRIADISYKIREAIRQSLPTPPEQHMTVMIPGKVVNLDDYKTEGSDMLLPQKTELANAILCDDMPPLATIAMGPTGRSVARSYSAAISKLVPAGTPIGIDDEAKLSDGQRRYKKAVAILSAEVADRDMTVVELYTSKQKAYTDAVSKKNKAFREAQDDAIKNSNNKKEQRANYDQWVQENALAYRNAVQAAYMDWVITGKKEEVEYWFAVVDQDTALARIEKSKEVMRWAVVQDDDGSCEYNKVKLTPSDWANKCIDKIGKKETKSADWYNWEIERLRKTNQVLEVLKANPDLLQTKPVNAAPIDTQTNKDKLDKAIKEVLENDAEYKASVAKNADPATRKEKLDALQASHGARDLALRAVEADRVQCLMKDAATDQNQLLLNATEPTGFIASQITANTTKIADLERERNALQPSVPQGMQQELVLGNFTRTAGVPAAIPKPPPEPESGTSGAATEASTPAADYFTPITVSISADVDKSSQEKSASACSFGASVSYGLLKVEASGKHEQAQAQAQKEMMNSAVNISFEVMRVDITRPWLRGELFYDEDLVPGPHVKISPGFGKLKDLMERTDAAAEVDKGLYSTFPMYPTGYF